MYILIIALFLLVSVLMIGIVLIQESKGGGLASGFASGNQMLGVRKTTSFLEKATWGLAIAMVVLSVLSVGFLPQKASQGSEPVESTMTINQPVQQQNQSFATSGNAEQAAQQAQPANTQQAPAK